MKFVRIFDQNNVDLRKFRVQAIQECGGTSSDIHLNGGYKKIISELKTRELDRFEDIYKYTDEKWNQVEFDHIDTLYLENEIVCISGVKIYGKWARGAMFYFGLKEHRIRHASAFFRDNGGLDRLKEYSLSKGSDGIFISIYPHNNPLRVLSRRLKENRGIPTSGNIKSIRELRFRGTHVFNGVEQDFFAIEFNANRFSFSDISEAVPAKASL